MKRILAVFLVVGGLFTGGYYYMTGRLPWVALSEEEQQVIALREDFERARQQWQAAGRTQALGVDASSQVESPLATLERVERDLAQLEPHLKATEAKNRATILRRDLAAFKSEMR
jgi:outer membrane murein-binding lipoprotein Lpp